MVKRQLIGKIVVIVAIVAVAAVAGVSLFTTAEAKGPCICPKIYAPVECDNGKVYANQCLADCRHAKNCTPIGVL